MPAGPIITLTTDFGVSDFYVAAMKAVLLQHCPDARLLDITHQVFRHDVRSASFTLERAVSSFGPGVVHLAVVDPGVGSERGLLIAMVNGSTVVCPDNGLITWTCRRYPAARIAELTWRPVISSNTFHGRDIMAPVAGMLAAGILISRFCGQDINPVLLDIELSKTTDGRIIHIDHFGNATTNVAAELLSTALKGVMIRERLIVIGQTYAQVPVGTPVALIGSSGLLEIAVRNGSAAEVLNLQIGDDVTAVH